MTRSWILGLILVLATAFVATAGPVNAQGDDKMVSIELNQADVRSALKLLFDQTGANYTIDQAVQGTVTVKLKDVPFTTALRSVLSQVKSTYRITGGVYEIVVREEQVAPTADAPADKPADTTKKESVTRIPIYHADPYIVMMLAAGQTPPYPEISSQSAVGSGGGMGGYGGGGSGFGGGGMGGGGYGGLGGGGFGGGGMGGGGFGGGLGGGGFGGGMGGGGFGGLGGGGFGGGLGGGGFGGGMGGGRGGGFGGR